MAAPMFRNEDEAAQYYLSSLRGGTREEKVVARDGLAAIFSRRGLFEEAAELYELNIRAGVQTPELFERLSNVYRQLGDHESADAALVEARRRRVASAAPAPVADSEAEAARPAPSRPRQEQPPAAPRLLHFPGSANANAQPAGPSGVPAPPRVGPGSRMGRPLVASARGSAAPALARELDLDAPPDFLSSARASLPEQVPAVTARMPAAPWPAVAPGQMPEASAPEVGARRRGGLPAPVAVLGIVFGMIVVPVVLLAVLVVNPIALYLEGRAAGPPVDAQAGEPPRLKVAPGASSAWYVQDGRSVSGLWASPGLELALDQDLPGAGRTFAVTAQRPQSWGETITIVERRGQGRANQQTVVPATFAAPSSLPPTGTVLDGRISGQLTAPRLSESSQFNTTTEDVNLPVRLVVVSTPELWLDRFVNALRMYADEDRWLLVTIGALLAWCVLAGAAALAFRIGQR
jgi:hypothetical protein